MNQACSGLRHGLDRSEPTRTARSRLQHFGDLRAGTLAPHTLTTLFLSPEPGQDMQVIVKMSQKTGLS